MNRQRQIYLFLFAIMIGFCLYVPFRSIQWDVNGIIEAKSVDAGDATMFSANHMLYRPLSYSIFQVTRLFGYNGNSAPVLQYVTALAATLGIGFFFLCVHNLTNKFNIALLATLLLGTSWSYWKFSIDISYIIPAAMFVCIALFYLQKAKDGEASKILILGLLTGISILFWQANIFLIPAFIVAINNVASNEKNTQRSLTALGLFAAALGLTVFLAYMIVPRYVLGMDGLTDLMQWGASHGADVSGRAPMWGKWDINRLLPAGVNMVASFVPIWEGLGLRRLLAGDLQPEKILSLMSLVALLILGATTFLLLYRRLMDKSLRLSKLIWLFMGYVLYLPFIIWWEPFETRWFVIPNIFLVMAMAYVWSTELSHNPKSQLVYFLGGCILVIGVANFTSTIWKYHSTPNPRMQLAQCFAENANARDTFIPTDWNWFGYTVYFFDYRGSVLDLNRGTQYDEQNIKLIEAELLTKNMNEGNIYVMDFSFYTRDESDYFENEVGFPIHLLTEFEQISAFNCGDVQFMKIVHLKAE